MTIRVLVADDQAVVRDGVVLLLSSDPEIEVVGEASDGRKALTLAGEHNPDVVLADLRMPELDGAQMTAELLASGSKARVLVLTTFADDAAVLPALRAGAAGYLTKDATSETLLSAVREVAAGRTVLDPAVQQRLVELVTSEGASSGVASGDSSGVSPGVSSGSSGDSDSAGAHSPAGGSGRDGALGRGGARGLGRDRASGRDGPVGGLTRREVDVVRLVAQGLNNRQVSREMVVSEATVKTHINHILAKLGLDDRSGLIAWAWRQGIVEP